MHRLNQLKLISYQLRTSLLFLSSLSIQLICHLLYPSHRLILAHIKFYFIESNQLRGKVLLKSY